MHAYRFGMNFEETIVGKLTEAYQTVHLKEFTDFPKKDEKDPTEVFTDRHSFREEICCSRSLSLITWILLVSLSYRDIL